MATVDRRLNRPARQVFAAAPLAVLIALTGCATGDGGPAAPSPSGSPSSTALMNPTPPVDDATVEPVPEAGDDSQAAAIQSAEDAVTAYGRPDLSYDAWINGLYPYLSQTGAAAYEDTDPARIPVRHVTGRGVILAASTEVALIVQVPTDAGAYNVSLSRPSPDAPWLADRIRPADG